MKKLSIAVDLDSTLNNLDVVWFLEDYNKFYNDNLVAEDIIDWDPLVYVKPECGNKIFDILKTPGYFYNLGIKDKWTIAGFKLLCDNYDVYIVSSCKPETIVDKINWVKKHLPFFNTENFIACHPKHIINCDYLIDDGPHNFEKYENKGIVIDMPYNRKLEKDNVIRVSGWDDIVDYFTREHKAKFF